MKFEVVRCCRKAGLLPMPHEYVFRVYKDGSVDVDIRAVKDPAPSQIEPQGASAEGSMVEYKMMGGRVVNVSCEASEGYTSETYQITFDMICFDRLVPMQTTLPQTTMHLQILRGPEGNLFDYKIGEITYLCQEYFGTQLNPLALGTYKFHGLMKMSDDLVNEGCELTLFMLHDGTFQGDFQVSSSSLSSSIAGRWTKDRVQFTWEEHQPGNSTRIYKFDLKCLLSGLRGVCTHNGSEFASLELRPVRVARIAWSPAVHQYFPRPFRTTTKLLMLSCLRAPLATQSVSSLPCTLWMEVLSFCSDDWFNEEDTDEWYEPLMVWTAPLPFGKIVSLGAVIIIVFVYFLLG